IWIDPWQLLRATGTISVSAVAGAAVARRWLVANPSKRSLVALSTFITTGVLHMLIDVTRALELRWAAVPSVVGGLLAAGALSQCVVPVRRVWTCSVGAAIWVAFIVFATGRVATLWPALALAPLIAAAGAQLWCRLARVPGEATSVPPAQVQ